MAILETWFVTNNHSNPIPITDIISPYTVSSRENVDLLTKGNNTAENLSNSIIIRNNNKNIITTGTNAGMRYLDSNYNHSHNEFSLIGHTHIGLDILTAGPTSDADKLHTHNGLTTVNEVNNLINTALNTGTDLTGVTRVSGDLSIGGILTVGPCSIYEEAGPTSLLPYDELNWRGVNGQLVKILDKTGVDLFKVFDDSGADVFVIENDGTIDLLTATLGGGTVTHNDYVEIKVGGVIKKVYDWYLIMVSMEVRNVEAHNLWIGEGPVSVLSSSSSSSSSAICNSITCQVNFISVLFGASSNPSLVDPSSDNS